MLECMSREDSVARSFISVYACMYYNLLRGTWPRVWIWRQTKPDLRFAIGARTDMCSKNWWRVRPTAGTWRLRDHEIIDDEWRGQRSSFQLAPRPHLLELTASGRSSWGRFVCSLTYRACTSLASSTSRFFAFFDRYFSKVVRHNKKPNKSNITNQPTNITRIT